MTECEDGPGEPRGPRLWLALALVVILAGVVQGYGMSRWPMADDEVLSPALPDTLATDFAKAIPVFRLLGSLQV